MVDELLNTTGIASKIVRLIKKFVRNHWIKVQHPFDEHDYQKSFCVWANISYDDIHNSDRDFQMCSSTDQNKLLLHRQRCHV